MRRVVTVVMAVVALLVGLAGYAALDAYDLVPGVLTLAPAPDPQPVLPPGATATTPPPVAQPSADPSGMPLAASGAQAPQPSPAALQAALAPVLVDSSLRGAGVTVRDAATGAHLLDQLADTPLIPASTVKLLAGAAVDATFAPGATQTTTVVEGPAAGGVPQVFLVAGGDTLLAPGAGDPSAVVGRAGLGDLVAQTAAALKAQGATAAGVHLDLSYAPGPLTAPTWLPGFVGEGITGAVATIGLSSQRATPGRAGPSDPPAAVAAAFVAGLKTNGIEATLTGRDAAPAGATPLAAVTSAPVADQLALALVESDDALTESLARQAAFTKGAAPTFQATADYVEATLAGLGVDVSGVTLVDASGLSRQNLVPARVVGDVIALGATPPVRSTAFATTLRGLAVAGLDGTLSDRFLEPGAHVAAGVAQAKTGTLTGVSGLAGLVVTADGRLLTYDVITNAATPGAGTLAARAALDRFVAVLASCGCR